MNYVDMNILPRQFATTLHRPKKIKLEIWTNGMNRRALFRLSASQPFRSEICGHNKQEHSRFLVRPHAASTSYEFGFESLVRIKRIPNRIELLAEFVEIASSDWAQLTAIKSAGLNIGKLVVSTLEPGGDYKPFFETVSPSGQSVRFMLDLPS